VVIIADTGDFAGANDITSDDKTGEAGTDALIDGVVIGAEAVDIETGVEGICTNGFG
jgi:hypothetical protein